MKWGIDIDQSQIEGLERDLVQQILYTVAQEQAEDALALINQRVQRGIGVNDIPMKPYSPAYKKKREESGRAVAVRNLTWTGEMLKSMYVKQVVANLQEVKVDIGFTNQDAAAKAAYNQQRTPWFGISPQDEATLRRIAEERLRAIFGGL